MLVLGKLLEVTMPNMLGRWPLHAPVKHGRNTASGDGSALGVLGSHTQHRCLPAKADVVVVHWW
jgi:hypothetical protein